MYEDGISNVILHLMNYFIVMVHWISHNKYMCGNTITFFVTLKKYNHLSVKHHKKSEHQQKQNLLHSIKTKHIKQHVVAIAISRHM